MSQVVNPLLEQENDTRALEPPDRAGCDEAQGITNIWQPGYGNQDLVSWIWYPSTDSQDLLSRIWKAGSGSQDLEGRIW